MMTLDYVKCECGALYLVGLENRRISKSGPVGDNALAVDELGGTLPERVSCRDCGRKVVVQHAEMKRVS